MSSLANKYFTILEEYRLVICRECRYAVWPSETDAHLRRRHHVSKSDRVEISTTIINSWHGLILTQEDLQLPKIISGPINILAKPLNGWRCRKSDNCNFVCGQYNVLTKHWRKTQEEGGHNWYVKGKQGKGGSLTKQKQKEMSERAELASEKVLTQRFFNQGYGSSLVAIIPPQPPQTPTQTRSDDGDNFDIWASITAQSQQMSAQHRKDTENQVAMGQSVEINPWLERTGWIKYLEGYHRKELLALMERPDPSGEPGLYMIWIAMERLGVYCQTQVSRCGVTVRTEAIRTEKHQNRTRPLETYWNLDSIKRGTEPWQRIIMIIYRVAGADRTLNSYPQIKLTHNQYAALTTIQTIVKDAMISDSSSESESDLAESEFPPKLLHACLDFCMSLLSQTMKKNEYELALVCALAILGLSKDGWKDTESYPPILSSIIKLARFMVVTKAIEVEGDMSDDEDEEFAKGDCWDYLNPGRPVEQTDLLRTTLGQVKIMMDLFMVRGTHTPMQWILDLRTYGMKIHYSTTAPGHVQWLNSDELLYKNFQFTMREFRAMIHGTIQVARSILEDLLFYDAKARDIPTFTWNLLRDDPSNTKPGWNFLQDARTVLPIEKDGSWLFDRIASIPDVKTHFERPGSASGINQKAVDGYMQKVQKFLGLLLILMHLTGGQPARGTELLSIMHSNTAKATRNIFIEDGLVVFVTQYHKGYAITADPKMVHRYLPKEIGELLLLYLWLILPFHTRLQIIAPDYHDNPLTAHLWPASCNGLKWSSGAMRIILQRITEDGLGHPVHIADYRNIAIAISRRFMRGRTVFEDDEYDEQPGEDQIEAIADEQAGHASATAGAIYARFITEMSGAIAGKRELFRKISIDWHQFLGFHSAIPNIHTGKKDPFGEDAEKGKYRRWLRLRTMDLLIRFKAFMGNIHAEFRGNQEAVLEAICAGNSPIVAIMPTGMGKSLLFMLPAWAEDSGTTIVVVPLISLRQNMAQRCKKLGIRCAEWSSQRPTDAETIVLVTPEATIGIGFRTFIARLKYTRQLDRIVIDECHMLLDRDDGFRPKLQQLGQLAALDTQLLLLTATLPPQDEQKPIRKLGWDVEHVQWFRVRTTRINISYSVVEMDEDCSWINHDQCIVGLVRGEAGKIVIYCNSIIRVKRLAQRLQGMGIGGCDEFHAKRDMEAKECLIKEFTSGKVRCVVATSAFGEGVDIPDIRLIIHADEPRSLLGFGQESGRAGRDTYPARSILVKGSSPTNSDKVRLLLKMNSRCRRIILDQYFDGVDDRTECLEHEARCDVCRTSNTHLSKSMEVGAIDYQEEEQRHRVEGGSSPSVISDVDMGLDHQAEEQRCRVEGGNSPSVISDVDMDRGKDSESQAEYHRQRLIGAIPRQRFKADLRSALDTADYVRSQLANWSGVCLPCRGGSMRSTNHALADCIYSKGAKEAASRMYGSKRSIKYAKYAACFSCGLPQSMCAQWLVKPGDSGSFVRTAERCQYPEVLLSTLHGVQFGYDIVWNRWTARLKQQGVDVADWNEVIKFLGRKKALEFNQGTNLVWEWAWIIEQVSEQE